MGTCAICYGDLWIVIERYPGSSVYHQCPVCCFWPPLERPWAWERIE